MVMDESPVEKLHRALTESAWSKLEQQAHKLSKRNLISASRHSLLVAESIFQSQFEKLAPWDLNEHPLDELGPLLIEEACLKGAHRELGKIGRGGEDGAVGVCLLAKLYCFEGRFEDCLGALDKLGDGSKAPYAELEAMLQFEQIDPDATPAGSKEGTSMADDPLLMLQRIFAIQACYVRAVSLEQLDRMREALQQYILLTTFFRQMRGLALIEAPCLAPFFGLAMYRLGMLSFHLGMALQSGDQRMQRCLVKLIPTADEPGEVLIEIVKRLLRDAGISLRMFLCFQPNRTGLGRMRAALNRYMESLEGRFGRLEFRSCFDAEQYLANCTTFESKNQLFCPESVGEDLILCSQLLESLYPQQPTNKIEAQCGGSTHPRQRIHLQRMARYGVKQMVVKHLEYLFQRFAAPTHFYADLLLAQDAAKNYHLAYLAGHFYVQMGGHDVFSLLVFAKVCIWFPSRTKEARSVLQQLLGSDSLQESFKLTALRLLALVSLHEANMTGMTQQMMELRKEAASHLLEALKLDPLCAILHRLLGLVWLQQGHLEESEEALKTSIQLEEANSLSWFLLALLKTAQKDMMGCLQICAVQLDAQLLPHLDLCLLKTAVLADLGLFNEAFEFIQSVFSFFLGSESGKIAAPSIMHSHSSASMERSAGSKQLSSEQVSGLVDANLPSFDTVYRQFLQTIASIKLASSQIINEEELLKAVEHCESKKSIAIRLWIQLSTLYLQMNRLQDAKDAIEQCFLLDKLSADVFHALGLIFERQGSPQALEQFERAILLQKDHLPAHLALARLLIGHEDHDERILGEHYAQEALLLEPDCWEAHSLYGRALEKTGRPADAGRYYRKAIELERNATKQRCEVFRFPVKYFA